LYFLWALKLRQLPDTVDALPLWQVEMLTANLREYLMACGDEAKFWEQWFELEDVALDLPQEWEEALAQAREEEAASGGYALPPPGWESMPRAKEGT
jgi:hypothetical protein